jgi:hypothetical protein
MRTTKLSEIHGWDGPISILNKEELLRDTISSDVRDIENSGKYYLKPNPNTPGESYIYRIDVFDKEKSWYYSEWFDFAGDSTRREYYEI